MRWVNWGPQWITEVTCLRKYIERCVILKQFCFEVSLPKRSSAKLNFQLYKDKLGFRFSRNHRNVTVFIHQGPRLYIVANLTSKIRSDKAVWYLDCRRHYISQEHNQIQSYENWTQKVAGETVGQFPAAINHNVDLIKTLVELRVILVSTKTKFLVLIIFKNQQILTFKVIWVKMGDFIY